MLYCTKCRNVCEDKLTVCPNCKRSRSLRPAKDDDMVLLQKASEFEADELSALFEEHGIRFSVEPYKLGVVTSPFDSGVMPTDKNIFVAYGDIDTAQEAIIRFDQDKPVEEVPDDMPRGKRIAIEVVSILAFLIIVSLVVFASDFAANGIKDFFTGLFG
jgi:hypothetical protein